MTPPPSELPERYDPEVTEARWQSVWDAEKAFHAEPVARDGEAPTVPDAPKAYVLEMLPYPSGEIHMGHVKNYTMGDVVAHHRRRTGHVVFHPMGYDAFGLPAENAAIRTGEPPAEVTARNIASIRAQLRRLGFSIDWDVEISTADPEYYRWTQWIFLRFLEKGLVERREAAVNWCPADQTVLANEQVVDGLCERCKSPVELRQLPQWFLRITDYAQALLDDMDLLDDWPERVLTMQRNWIGRSVGARVEFALDDGSATIPVFTTRPDTLHGATFFLMAPEHPMVPRLVEGRPEQADVTADVGTAARTAVAERSAAERPKTGVFTGALLSTRLPGHLDKRMLLWMGFLIQAAGLGLGQLSPTVAGFVLGSFALGLPFTAMSFFAMQEARRLRGGTAASFMGLLTATYGLGQVLGPILVAQLLRHTEPARGFDLALWVATAALLGGALVFAGLQRRYPRKAVG